MNYTLGPKGLGRPFTARNKPFTACATRRREVVENTMSRLEKRLERQNEQLLLEKLGLREEHKAPTPEEIRLREHAKRTEERRAEEARKAEERARRLKLEEVQRAAERAEADLREKERLEEEKAEAMRVAKKKAEAEKAAREAANAARMAERAARDLENARQKKKG